MKFGTKIVSAEKVEDSSVSVDARKKVASHLLTKINPEIASKLPFSDLQKQVENAVAQICVDEKININGSDQKEISYELANDMIGLGPLEPLMADDAITDIMVSGYDTIYVDRRGEGRFKTKASFRDDRHLVAVAQRIARNVGRKVDESSPLVDARLKDGSRVNIVFPPIALDGASISIRKFPKDSFGLQDLARMGAMSDHMCQFLQYAANARMNFMISGGTGSGKTTLLNAMTRYFDSSDRIVTIEDAAELRIQQPHVVRMETRVSSSENKSRGVDQADLVKNALRMNPDRIIIGETRGEEAFSLLQAMNTGHDGSCSSLHANGPREAISRLENMVLMAGYELPQKAIRTQIASAVDIVIQIEKMRDKSRRITKISEVIGLENDVVVMQDLFTFNITDFSEARITGKWVKAPVKPKNMTKFIAVGLEGKISSLFGGK